MPEAPTIPAPSPPVKNIPQKYGILLPRRMTDLELEYIAFLGGASPEEGLGRYQHFKNIAKIYFPELIWHDWLKEQIHSLCDEDYGLELGGGSKFRNISWTGCGSAGKTFAAGLFGYIWWTCSPTESIVILTSTTKDMIRRRVWPVVSNFFHESRRNIATHLKLKPEKVIMGHLLESRTTLQSKKGDDKNAMFAIAVKEGETSKAVANIQGQHGPRILIVIDEATNTPEAIFGAISNLRKGCRDLTVLSIGNAVSRMDPHGRMCEPARGWGSINAGSLHWATKGVRAWQVEPGHCFHFEGAKSPNVKAGRTLYPFIYTWEDHCAAIKDHGSDSVYYWTFDKGFWPPDGQCNTVMSETMIQQYDVGALTFSQSSQKVGALDPAFGGDDCIYRIGTLGDIANGKSGLNLDKKFKIIPKATSEVEKDQYIAHEVMRISADEGVKPHCFGMDATGTGRGVFSHLYGEWSNQIKRVEFGGTASDLPASGDDSRPSTEVYDRRVTELWFSCREFLRGGQLRGLDVEERIQFTTRQYGYKAKRLSIETKEDCKTHLMRSPDDADAVAVLVEVCRQLGAVSLMKEAGGVDNIWLAKAKEVSAIYDDGQDQSAQTQSALFDSLDSDD